MSVKLDIFNAIKTSLEDNVAEVETVKIWNNQLENEDREKPKGYPAVFVHFSNMEWDQTSQSAGSFVAQKSRTQEQKGVFEVTLHCAMPYLEDETTSFPGVDTLVDKIFKYTVGLKGTYFSYLKRMSEEQDIDHDRLIDHKIVYSCGVMQCGLEDEDAKSIPGGTLALELNRDIDIDSEIIRTGDGEYD